MSVKQSDFASAILDADRPVPDGMCNPDGTRAAKRFDVYRNNVAVSLTEALEVTFPVVRKLVGNEFFTAMAGVFLRQHPPDSPVLMFYGAGMPGFLQGFAPVSHLGYLPDVARIELALCRSYHAKDVPALDPASLQLIDPDLLLQSRITLAPATHLIRSDWPAASIFLANSSDQPAPTEMQPEDILIARPEYDPQVIFLPPGAGDFLGQLMQQETLARAIEAANTRSGDFDLTETLSLLLGKGVITAINEGTDQ